MGQATLLVFASPSWGAASIVTKTHFLRFGSYRINDPRIGRVPRLEPNFKNGIFRTFLDLPTFTIRRIKEPTL